jgi:hypothetical protein
MGILSSCQLVYFSNLIWKVIDLKFKSILLSIGLLISLPSLAFAHPDTPGSHGGHGEKAPCCPSDDQHHHKMHRDWQEKMAEREAKLTDWVNQYTPDKKTEWTKVLAEKKTLRNQWMSPENKTKREKWQQEKMTKFKELKKQLDEGKITKEEFMKKMHGEKGKAHWMVYHELEKAVEAKNNQQAALLLNQLLTQYKQHNVMLNEMLK